ncbi:MAG: response regulator [bacterium]|nr:response regulator [bacterium]
MAKKILLVDDEPSLRRTMTLGLSQAGYDTEPCENGITALKKLETYAKNKLPLEGIVVDVHLPDISGLKLVKIMKFKYPGVPIVLITGFADRYNMEEIRNLEVHAFLEKPFSPDELAEQFIKIMEEKAGDDKLVKEADEEAAVQAYLLVKIEENAAFVEIYKQLHLLEPVVYCDATKGNFDIFLLVQQENKEKICTFAETDIRKMEGVKNVEILDVQVPVLDDSTRNIIKDAEHVLGYFSAVSEEKDKVCAYLLMEVEKEKQQDLYLNLRLNENVVFCDYTSGKFNMAAMIKMDQFGDIDRLISTKINPLPGVVKIRKYPIIKLFEM